jgi:rare lipoprotein A
LIIVIRHATRQLRLSALIAAFVCSGVLNFSAHAATGTATYYADRFEGRKTASSETFRQNEMTAAHNALPFGTRVKVTNLLNGRSVVVRVNDRMHARNRILIDVSKSATAALGFVRAGKTSVLLEIVR